MRRFRPVLDILRQYRLAMAIGSACILVTRAANMSMPHFIKSAFDAMLTTKEDGARLVFLLAAGLVGVACVRGLFQYWMRWLLMGASRRLETDLRQRVFEHLTSLHFGWFDTARTGDILSRLTADV